MKTGVSLIETFEKLFTWPRGDDLGGHFYAAYLCVRTVCFRGLLAKLLRVATFIFLLSYYILQTIKDLLWQVGQR